MKKFSVKLLSPCAWQCRRAIALHQSQAMIQIPVLHHLCTFLRKITTWLQGWH